ncbi:MAG: hypothetical protein ACXQS2_01265 [Methermicoccaceae archaeon]
MSVTQRATLKVPADLHRDLLELKRRVGARSMGNLIRMLIAQANGLDMKSRVNNALDELMEKTPPQIAQLADGLRPVFIGAIRMSEDEVANIIEALVQEYINE